MDRGVLVTLVLCHAIHPPAATHPPPIAPTTVRGPSGSPLVVTYGPQMREALVLDPRTGDPLRRIALPETGLVFGTIVDGTPVAGVVLGAPLRVVVF